MLGRQLGDRLGRPVEALRQGQQLARPGGQLLQHGYNLQPGIAQRVLRPAWAAVGQGGKHGGAILGRGIQRRAPGPQRPELAQVLQLDPQGLGQLGVGGVPADLHPQALLQPPDPPQALGIDPRHRDRVACSFDRPAHRLADPPVGEGAEAVPPGRVEPLYRSGEPQVPLLNEVQQLQGRPSGAHPGHEPHHQPQVRHHEPVPGFDPGGQGPALFRGQGSGQLAEGHRRGDAATQLQLLGRGQEGVTPDLLQVSGQGRVAPWHGAGAKKGRCPGSGP